MRAAVALAFVLGAIPGRALAWSAVAHERIAALAIQLMPPSLASQLVLHRAALAEGLREPDLASGPSEHALNLDGSGGDLDRRAAEAAAALVTEVREQGSFADIAHAFGVLSHYAADAAFPLDTSDSDGNEPTYYGDFTAYCDAKFSKFPPVFDGYARLDDGFDPAAYVRTIAERANRAYPFIGQAYYPDRQGRMKSSASFDDRGPVFGVAQLSFSHAVTATANLWLYAWREAHGDLDGTPHYRPGRNSGAQDRARAPQRP